MRQLANGLMGNEGASVGNRWLDAELHSIHRIHAVLYTCNMPSSKCDSPSVAKPITPNLPFDIYCNVARRDYESGAAPGGGTLHGARDVPNSLHSKLHLHNELLLREGL